jgi:hypothetical protein
MLAERTEQAARELGLPHEVHKVTDVKQIAAYQVLATPALAIDGVVQFAGRVPTVDAIKGLLAGRQPAR